MANKKRLRKSPDKIRPKHKVKTVYKMLAIIGVILMGVIIFSDLLKKPSTEEEYMFKKEGELTITDSLGNAKVKLDIEIADNEFDRQLGLMFRREMEENTGMLFVFLTEELQSFWMRNTYIPLDIMFINSDKKIITIHKSTIPLSDKSHPSTEPAKYVLEVNAGFTNKYNISTGDKIIF